MTKLDKKSIVTTIDCGDDDNLICIYLVGMDEYHIARVQQGSEEVINDIFLKTKYDEGHTSWITEETIGWVLAALRLHHSTKEIHIGSIHIAYGGHWAVMYYDENDGTLNVASFEVPPKGPVRLIQSMFINNF